MRILIVFLIVQKIWVSVALGGDLIKEFKKPREPFREVLLAEYLYESMLPMLSGVIEVGNVNTVCRITEIGGWGSSNYTLFFDKKLNLISVIYSHRRVLVDDGKRSSVMVSKKFIISTNEKKNATNKFNWNLYEKIADQAKSGKLERVGGDDIPFVLAERISNDAGYSGIYFASSLHKHLEKITAELEVMINRLQVLEPVCN